MDHPHDPGVPACGRTSRIDEQILAIWRGLRSNPSLDARWAMQAIDRLLDERPRPGQVRPAGPVTAMSPGLASGAPAQEAIWAGIVQELLTEEP